MHKRIKQLDERDPAFVSHDYDLAAPLEWRAVLGSGTQHVAAASPAVH
jgi:hypothetical protein